MTAASDKSHVLYRFFSENGQLLYVGITMNPPQRFKSHEHEKFWWSEVSGIRVEQHESREKLIEAERLAIKIERPIHNVVHNRPFSEVSRLKPVRRHESLISYRCRECKGLVTKSNGYIHVSLTEAERHREAWDQYRSERVGDFGLVWTKLDDLEKLPEPAPWLVHHKNCDPNPGEYCYWFYVNRADTHEKLLSWTAHLLDKSWLQDTDWADFLYSLISESAKAC